MFAYGTITAQKIAQKIVTKTEKGFNQYTTKTQLFFVGGQNIKNLTKCIALSVLGNQ